MISGLNHITLAVTDIDKSFHFYHEILGLTPLVKWDRGAYFLVGDFWFCLNVDKKREPATCYTHYAFTVSDVEFEKLCQELISAGVALFKENTSPGKSLYFLDPDGHKLEIHVGNWRSRIEAKQEDAGDWEDVRWFF